MVKTLNRQCPGADLWQIPLPTSAHCPRQSQSQLSGEEVVSEPAYHFSPLHNFSFGDLDNKLGFRNDAYFCVNKSNRIKNKTKQKAVGLSSMNGTRTKYGL